MIREPDPEHPVLDRIFLILVIVVISGCILLIVAGLLDTLFSS